MTDSADAALADAAADLYALDPDDFTARRNALAAGADERDLGRRIRRLPKPVAAAWLLNMLARREPERLDALARLGQRIAEAQEELDADALRTTARERSSLVSSVTRDAVALADELGRPASESVARDVESTLEAAVVNPAVADAVLGGLLAKAPLAPDSSGRDIEAAVALSGAAAPRRSKPTRADSGDELAHKRRDKAEKAVADAETELGRAETEYAQLGSKLDDAHDRRDDLADEKDELERRLREISRALESLDDDIETLEADRGDAHTRTQQSRRDLRKARRALGNLPE